MKDPRGGLTGLLAAVLLGLIGCAESPWPAAQDSLPSWTQGPAKLAILDFVARVSDESGSDYVAPEDRVAAFDNDGTLIVERPAVVQFEFLYQRIRELAPEHPDWSTTEPFRTVLADDREALGDLSFGARGEIVTWGQANLFQADFATAVNEFLATGRHPRFGVRFTALAYQPMLELVDYLQANQFRVFIVSGGGIEFIREFSETLYGVPRERVIGSSMKADLYERDGKLEVFRKNGWNSLNAGKFKPLNIQLHAGRRPILAVGNSDGDLDMLRFTHDGTAPSLVMLLVHDDAEREYAYADEAPEALVAAREYGWQVVSMRDDFGAVFAAPGAGGGQASGRK